VAYVILIGMYLRTIKRKNKDGSVVTYYQLACNFRHPETNQPTARVIHSFGRADQLDRNELVRLCKSIARVCNLQVIDPLEASEVVSAGSSDSCESAEEP
jgi:hypothetical protein